MKKIEKSLVFDKIKNNINTFTKTEKKIAKFVSENQKDIAFYSIHDLSEKLKLGRASIIRFANKLGYDGFASFRKEVISELRNDITPLEKYKIHLHDSSDDNFSLNQIAKNEVDNINYTLNNLDKKSLDKSVDYIRKANSIYIVGMSLSSYLSGITSYLLQRIGYKAFYLNQPGLSFIEQLININSKDVLIAFSFPDFSKETIQAAEYAVKQKVKVIAITNSITAPIVEHSSSQLIVKTDSYNFTNSLSPIVVMIYGLISEVVVKDKNRSLKALDRVMSTR